MKILVAPDSFKDCLTAQKAGEAIRNGIEGLAGNWDIQILPMADGGEGTVEALIQVTNGRLIETEVFDPLMRPARAKFGILGDGKTAVLEMAVASGLELLEEKERNPWVTTTFGTGQLIKAALDEGCTRIILGIGGSATNDGGMGMARALGVQFFDKSGKPVNRGGGELSRIVKIDISGIDPGIANCKIEVACDVTNPLTGPDGASAIYAPQKGADKKMVQELDANLKYFAGLLKGQLDKDVENIPGTGAAGGLGAGLLAFTRADLHSGFEIVRRETHLDEHVKQADLVITGEGKIDYQTQFGKTPMGVCRVAKQYGKPVIAFAGTLGEGYTELYKLGFDAIFSIVDKPMTLKEALITAPQLLERCAQSVMCLWIAGVENNSSA